MLNVPTTIPPLSNTAEPAVAEPQTQTDEREQVQPPWEVVVFNDEEHSYQYVIMVFVRVLQISTERALDLAYEIDNCGEAVVAGGLTQQKAEAIASAIAGYGPDPFMVQINIAKGRPLEGLKTLAQPALTP